MFSLQQKFDHQQCSIHCVEMDLFHYVELHQVEVLYANVR